MTIEDAERLPTKEPMHKPTHSVPPANRNSAPKRRRRRRRYTPKDDSPYLEDGDRLREMS